MKTPIQRLRELVKILKNGDNLIQYELSLERGFFIEGIYQPKGIRVIFLMNDPMKKGTVIYLDDKDLSDDELLMIVEDLEKIL